MVNVQQFINRHITEDISMIEGTLYRIIFSIVLLSVVMLSCTQKKESTMSTPIDWEKMDVSLRSELRGNIENSSDAKISIIASVSEDNDAFVDELEALGVQVQSRIGVIWTLTGSAEAFAQASGKDFIKRMELSQQRRIP
jgi:hypothetical protein